MSDENKKEETWVSSVGLSLGIATRTVVDGLRKATGQMPQAPQPIEPLLKALSEIIGAHSDDYAALSEDAEFWQLISRLQRVRGRRARRVTAIETGGPAVTKDGAAEADVVDEVVEAKPKAKTAAKKKAKAKRRDEPEAEAADEGLDDMLPDFGETEAAEEAGLEDAEGEEGEVEDLDDLMPDVAGTKNDE